MEFDLSSGFGPKTEDEIEIFLREGFRVDIQHQIQKAMNALGWDEDMFLAMVRNRGFASSVFFRVSFFDDLFSEKCNLTMNELTHIFAVLKRSLQIQAEPIKFTATR